MSSVLDKQTANVELFKAGNFRQEISKSGIQQNVGLED